MCSETTINSGYLLTNGDYISCDWMTHSEFAKLKLGLTMDAVYREGYLRVGYIGITIAVDGLTITDSQLRTLQDMAIKTRFAVYISLYDRGSYDYTNEEFLSFTSAAMAMRRLIPDGVD